VDARGLDRPERNGVDLAREDRKRGDFDTGALESSGLYAPDAPDAAGRLELLEYLRLHGATVVDMVSADRAGRLVALAAEIQLAESGDTFSIDEVAARCGTTVDRIMRIRLAGGLVSDPAHDRLPATTLDDIAAFEAGAALFGDAATLSLTRVMGGALGRIAEAAVALFMSELRPTLRADETQVALAKAATDATAALQGLPPVMAHLLRDHVVQAIRRAVTERANVDDDRAVSVGIGFVDLVGSTEWASRLTLEEHALALGRFESAAWDIAAGHAGRVVKLIGDEVMFIAPTGTDTARIALDLCQTVAADTALPGARAAVGFGTVASRDGDYFGPLVNLVARAVKVAEPGSVVVTDAVRDELAASPAWSLVELSVPQLRGIDEPVRLFALR
jgi:adenylate cyclase